MFFSKVLFQLITSRSPKLKNTLGNQLLAVAAVVGVLSQRASEEQRDANSSCEIERDQKLFTKEEEGELPASTSHPPPSSLCALELNLSLQILLTITQCIKISKIVSLEFFIQKMTKFSMLIYVAEFNQKFKEKQCNAHKVVK